MKFPIKLNFDHNIKYLLIFLFLKILFSRFISINIYIDLIAFIISLICFLIRKQYFRNTKKNILAFQITKKYSKEIKSLHKEYFHIIIIYLLLLIIEILIAIFNLNIYIYFYNFIFIGIRLTSYLRKEKIYKHQKISYFILFFLFGFILFFHFLSHFSTIKNIIISSIVSILYYYSIGIINGYIKYSMEIKFIDPYFITTVELGFNVIFNLIYESYLCFWKNQVSFYFELGVWYNIFSDFIWSFIIFLNFLFNILVIYYYSPYHHCVCRILTYYYNKKIFFSNLLQSNPVINIIFYIINVFFSCVVAEIIILNFCNLDKDTKYQITKRSIISNTNDINE